MTVIAARRCMRVLVCVLLCARRMLSVMAVRRCMHVLSCLSGACTILELAVIAARRCIRVLQCVF
jgi:hypothetical protein